MAEKIHSQSERLFSLDVFRGLIIIGMILVNTVESSAIPQLNHVVWHGWTFADTIFPAFIWITGVAMVFSLTKRLELGRNKETITLQILRRSIILFLLGVFLYNFPFYHFSSIRILGILQRIALCYLIGGTIFLWTTIRKQIVFICLLLIGYWILLKFVSIPGFGAGIEQNGNIVQYVDLILLKGHLWSPMWDPEGIVSTLGAITTLFFGILVGQLLLSKRLATEKALQLLTSGILLSILGLVMDKWLPINKNLWTSSYAVFMAGLSTTIFSILYFLIDIKNFKKWAKPFGIYGMNSIIIYAFSILLDKFLVLIKFGGISMPDYLSTRLFTGLVDPANAQLLFAILYILFLYGIAYLMYKKNWIIKI